MFNLKNVILLSCVLLLHTFVYAQDGLLGEEEEESQEEVTCVPESLSVPFEKYANKLTNIEMRQTFSFGREYCKNKNYKDAILPLWKVYFNDSTKYANAAIGLIAECYFYENKIDSTLITCYKGLEKFPDNQKLHYYAGFIQNQLGKAVCAIPHYEALVEKNPDNGPYMLTLANLYAKDKDCEKAIEVQTKYINKFPNDPEGSRALAIYNSQCGKSSKDAWEKVWESDKSNFDAGRSYAKSAIDEGSYKEALEPLTTIISKNPTAQDYKLRATAYENLSQYTNAIKDLNEWLKLEPNNADIMLYVANDYMYLKRYSTANHWISQALHKKPGYGKAYITRGELYEYMVSSCQSGKLKLEDKVVYEEATKVYRQALSDLAFKSQAEAKINNLRPFVRTKEELFMEPNITVKNQCYEFLVGAKGVGK